MELRHLRYFVVVAEEENVTRASSRLHIAQPALSRQIRDLEDELGVQLLERSAKSIRLTEAGRTFLTEARAVLQRADEAVKAVQAVDGGVQGELHAGYAPSLTVQILPRTLRLFQAEFPRVRVILHDLSSGEMLSGLRDGKLHVALMVHPGDDNLRGLHFEELARYPVCVAVAPNHPLANARNAKWTRLASEGIIAYSRAEYPEYHDELENLAKLIGAKPRIVEEHDSVTSIIAAVEAGRGVALVASCIACLAGPRLKILPLIPASSPIIVGAIRRKDTQSATVQKFIAAAAAKET
jgi:DNA-binding transcriptional LysR family regulator